MGRGVEGETQRERERERKEKELAKLERYRAKCKTSEYPSLLDAVSLFFRSSTDRRQLLRLCSFAVSESAKRTCKRDKRKK